MTKEEFIAEIEQQKERGNRLLKQVQQLHVERNNYGDGMAVFGPAPLYYTPQEELEPVKAEYEAWKRYVHDFLQSILGKGDDFVDEWDLCLQTLYRHNVSDRDWYTKEIKEALGKLDSFSQRIVFRLKEVETRGDAESVNTRTYDSKKVFVVHGHAEAVNQEVARTLEKLGLEAIILREQPNSGKTIIEKFEEYAKDVNFAVILLTADDKIEGEETFRARQNVVFEMGYFMGALGRQNVMCMLQENVEKPGDIDGVIYTMIDKTGVWKYSLVKELKACGYDVDTNMVL